MQNSEFRMLVLCGAVLTLTYSTASLAQEAFLGRSVEQWSAALASGKGQERVEAAWALAQIAGREAGSPGDHIQFAELVKLVSDGDPSVRYWGVLGLAGYARQLKANDSGRGAALNTLAPLLEDTAPAPRVATAAALGQLGQSEKALPILVAALSDPQEATRIQAIAALEQLGPLAKPVEKAIQSATSDSSEYVKRISERALKKLNAAR